MSQQHNIFLKSEQLGIVEMRLEEAFKAETKRKRQVAFRQGILLLKLTKLISEGTIVSGYGYGINALGEKGFWVAIAGYTSVKAQGPQERTVTEAMRDIGLQGIDRGELKNE